MTFFSFYYSILIPWTWWEECEVYWFSAHQHTFPRNSDFGVSIICWWMPPYLLLIRLKQLHGLAFHCLLRQRFGRMLSCRPSSCPCPPTTESVCREQGGYPKSKLRHTVCFWSQEPMKTWQEGGLLYSSIWLFTNKREEQISKWLIRFETDNLFAILWVKEIFCPVY